MKLLEALLEQLDKRAMLQLQQDLIERLPLDIEVKLANLKSYSGFKIVCQLEGTGSTADKYTIHDTDYDHHRRGRELDEFVIEIIARLMKAKLKQVGFVSKHSGRWFLSRKDRAYTAVTYGSASNLQALLKILARSTDKTYTQSIFADVYVHSNDGIDDALKFLDEFEIPHDVSFLTVISKTFS